MRTGIALMVAITILIATLVAVAKPRHAHDHHLKREAAPAEHTEEPGDAIFVRPEDNAGQLLHQGRETFRFDTFGDEAFWGGQLRLHESVVMITPRQALNLGLKVDAEALSDRQIDRLLHGEIDLDDPAVTQQLLRQNAVVGQHAVADQGRREGEGSVGVDCHDACDAAIG